MKDIRSEIIYVGKANNIKSRVHQYFNGSDKRLKINSLTKEINSIEYIITNSELEALLLENNLIKENKPKYNTLLKDSSGYPYIEITLGDVFPKIQMSNTLENPKSKYFGPFPSINVVKKIIEFLNKTYKIRTCNKLPKKTCLYYQIGQCSAPCIKNISKEDYYKNIKQCINILSGNISKEIKENTSAMKAAAEKLNFEEAQRYKELNESLKYIMTSQRVSSQNEINEDVIGFFKEGMATVITLFMVRNGNIIGKEHFILNDNEIDEPIARFITQYYSKVTFFPKNIIISEEINSIETIEEYLKTLAGKKIKIITPKRGEKKKLVDFAVQNAKIIAFEKNVKINNDIKKKTEGIENLQNLLKIKELSRIESYDISNTSGVLNVASMVVFENGEFNKKAFRKFRLSIDGPDDYACMQEVIRRRFTDEQLLKTIPALLLIDGGQGQVSAVKMVLLELGIDIPIAGMVKDDNHKTKDLFFNGKELGLDKSSPEFKLLVNIQDRTHNFAINYHRNLRNKKMLES